MKNITFILIIILTVFSFSIFSTTIALADDPAEVNLTSRLTGVGTEAGYPSDNPNRLPSIVGNIIKAFLSLLGMIFMGYTVYGGWLWMSARGNEEQLTKAKAVIRGSIIGLIIVMSAYAITQFVISYIVVSTGYNPVIAP